MNYQTQSPVLFLLFNRPHTTQKVFEAIRQAAPTRLYIGADGPRAGIENEAELCRQARLITAKIDWPCDVKRLYRDGNLGCKEAVSSAIDWFFGHEEEGIILEDDCLPANDFFRFCDEMLSRYRDDSRIRHITGCNLQNGEQWGTDSYYFSNLTHVWGWASWRRVWRNYDKQLGAYQINDAVALTGLFAEPIISDAWIKIFEQLKAGEIDTWDYQLTLINFFNNGLSVIPNQNLISNIGFGEGATHTKNAQSKYAALPLQPLLEITHPFIMMPQRRADYATLAYDFDVERIKRKINKPHRRLKRWLKKCLNDYIIFEKND